MRVGKEIKSRFLKDNSVQRRSVGNLHDPESLISGKEIAQGMTYRNSSRDWPSEDHYIMATEGDYTPDQILVLAPRKFNVGAIYAPMNERVK
jgi:hypothetical protein